jgi:hypothetical protein
MRTDDSIHRRFCSLFEMGIGYLRHFQRAGGPIHNSLGQRPRLETIMLLRAEGPTHLNGETLWRESGAFIGVLFHIRHV